MWGFESSIPSQTAHSSSGPGHRPLKAEIAGSNPACATTHLNLGKAPVRASGCTGAFSVVTMLREEVCATSLAGPSRIGRPLFSELRPDACHWRLQTSASALHGPSTNARYVRGPAPREVGSVF